MEITRYRWDDVFEEELNPKLTRRLVNGEKASIALMTLKKGCRVPVHGHESEQYSLVLKGALKFTVSGKEWVVNKDEILYIPSHVPHGAEALEDTLDLDFFAPRREDWIQKQDQYLRESPAAGSGMQAPETSR